MQPLRSVGVEGLAAIIKALATPRQRARLEVSDPDLMRALAAAVDAPASEGFVVRPDGLARFRYKWGETTVQFHLVPKAASKVSIVVTKWSLSWGSKST